MRRGARAALCALALSTGCMGVVGSQAGGVVSTLAGTGLPAITDGPASVASFLMPVALAYDGAGNLIVVDAAAQRIRRIRRDGSVETVAGSGSLAPGATSVRGGYADGPGAAARFNWPRGVAVAKDGTIYVADTGNHCIRAVTPAGRVSVYAGSPARRGGDLGTRTQATFTSPMGLAAGTKGDLYVADPEIGLRKIDAAGNVTALPFGRAPTGVTVAEAQNALTLYVVDADGILIASPTGSPWRFLSLNRAGELEGGAGPRDPAGTVNRDVSMQFPVGAALSLAQLDGQLFYADPRGSTIRYAFPGYAFVQTIAGGANEDAAGESAGYRDGPRSEARFNEPLGTAATPDGASIAIADAGNRRVRLLRFDAPHDLVQKQDLVPQDAGASNAFHILYAGASWTWYDSTGADSIASGIEAQLRSDRALAAVNLEPKVRIFGGLATLQPLESVAKAVADLGVDGVMVVDATQITTGTDFGTAVAKPASWQPVFTAQLRAANAILKAAHIRLVVDIHPLPLEFSANEYPYSRMGLPENGGRIPDLRFEPLLRQAVLDAGVDLIDTYPDFRADARQPSEPVSGSVDSHYAVHGREVLGRAIARGLEKLAPWSERR
jgi:DNA-binding beta-propeller fold protein YncE